MIHLSDIKKYDRCEKLYWLSKKEPKQYLPFVFYNENLMELCKNLFQFEEYFEGNTNDDPLLALEAMKNVTVLINARFAYKDLRIKVPLMVADKEAWNLYFTYPACFPKEHEAQKIADTITVLELLHISVNQVYAIHLNADYIRGEQLDVSQLLCVTSCLYNHKNKPQKSILELVETHRRDIISYLPKLKLCESRDHMDSIRSNICTRGGKCTYFSECFPEEESDTSILHLISSSKKYEMQQEAIMDIKDADMERLEGTRQQYAQIMAAKHGIFFDVPAVHTWVKDCIQYPISYLDFEWETYAYPPYHGMKPYDVLCFQYSLHIEEYRGASLSHKEYLGVKDCREEFIVHLLQDIPKQGSILVFNMEGAEKLRLRQLAKQFPQYASELQDIWERMVDLSLPFGSGNIYDSRMRGFYSLKTLVRVFSDYSYEDLSISYGMDAVRNWRLMGDDDDSKSKEIRRHLLEYCAMDTYAEYIVFHYILDYLKGVGWYEEEYKSL